ncbi:MAG: AAA family ATPase [Clostridia bacterium]|nr:AAA family ATPase [Clostridia bacterium]
MKKLPYGISNYEQLITENYYYVDKTKYIEVLENLSERNIMFLRPRKFGKTLFTSTLEFYYDIKTVDKLEKLFSETYIGKNLTPLKNSYHILKFNFSGIDTSSVESTLEAFKDIVQTTINSFVQKYELDFLVNKEQSAEGMLNSLFEAFKLQKKDEKIYVIIDEYDHFANELLGFQTDKFKDLVSKNGKVRKWYEILKKGTETVVDRIFITGVAPITLDSLTSGFNICSDKTRDRQLNEMLGFTKREIVELLENQKITKEEQDVLLPVLKENYDGYKFSSRTNEQVYNSNMCLYFLNEYITYHDFPERLVDMNIASDYGKLSKMLELCKGDRKLEILQSTIAGEKITGNLVEKFNPVIEFGNNEFVSMLFYLGYLTISGEWLGKNEFIVPNKIMKEIYSEYFLNLIEKETNLKIESNEYDKMLEEIALNGKIDTIVEVVHKYLNNLSNRDYQRFDEKNVKVIFYSIAMNFNIYSIKSEPEVNRKYPDILMVPRDISKNYQCIMIEFKYLKAGEKDKLEDKQREAKEQIKEYCEFEDIKKIQNLNKYTIVAVNDELFVEKID